MEPLIFPQCGGKITEYRSEQHFATCEYCSTKFLIEDHKESAAPDAALIYTPFEPARMMPIVIGVLTNAFSVKTSSIFATRSNAEAFRALGDAHFVKIRRC